MSKRLKEQEAFPLLGALTTMKTHLRLPMVCFLCRRGIASYTTYLNCTQGAVQPFGAQGASVFAAATIPYGTCL